MNYYRDANQQYQSTIYRLAARDTSAELFRAKVEGAATPRSRRVDREQTLRRKKIARGNVDRGCSA